MQMTLPELLERMDDDGDELLFMITQDVDGGIHLLFSPETSPSEVLDITAQAVLSEESVH